MIVIRPYEPQHDELQVYNLWKQTLGQIWPLPYEAFQHVIVANPAYQPGDHFVAQFSQEIAGFVGIQVRTIAGELSPRGELMVVLVASAYQRQGIGRALHDHALAALKQRGVKEVQLGAGGLSYFWAGIPTNLPDAWLFFQACGWIETERSFDLIRDLADYTTPIGIYERLSNSSVTIASGIPADIPAIQAFEERHFPRWLPYYQRVTEHDGYTDVVVAKDRHQEIVGTSSVMEPHATWWQHDIIWTQLLGENIGGVGPLGVAEAMREKGIGLALAARVTELLQKRGVAKSYIGYTWLVDWYGKLGYRVWREYIMSRRKL